MNTKISSLIRVAIVGTLLMQVASAEIYLPPSRDACGNYAAKAVYQFRSQKLARCGLKGARWSNDGAGQHQWCRTVRPQITENETKARATELMRCLNRQSSIQVNDLPLNADVLNNELESAASRGALERMQQLIAAGAEVESRQGRLMISAVISYNTSVVLFLKRFGIPLAEAGSNPLSSLLSYGGSNANAPSYRMMEFLLQQGINPNLPNGDGYVPLKTAIEYGDQKGVTLLLRYRANPNLDVNGTKCKTVMPLDAAIDRGNQQIIQQLRKAGARSQAQCGG
ncbi:ankyrin repeat domain-containing protein [Thiofilum flexile]|uniref:ankyrin repeat domain-containing protein n=1 Tax=Thiofilum flexile TaxID=125627 RepID=UPI00037EF260|nr:ankyrin repeat domain-containing protein [Thiofilum flexile]